MVKHTVSLDPKKLKPAVRLHFGQIVSPELNYPKNEAKEKAKAIKLISLELNHPNVSFKTIKSEKISDIPLIFRKGLHQYFISSLHYFNYTLKFHGRCKIYCYVFSCCFKANYLRNLCTRTNLRLCS